MTGEEWERCRDPHRLAGELYGHVGLGRKRRLFLCARARALFPALASPAAEWIDTAERYSDGLATQQDRQRVNALARDQDRRRTSFLPYTLINRATPRDASRANLAGSIHLAYRLQELPESLTCGLLRDVFGNPFRPVTFDPAWRTSSAVQLAGQVYEARDFGPMPVLADALQDAGCEHADILAHCRGSGPHARGCWVVDPVLGKA